MIGVMFDAYEVQQGTKSTIVTIFTVWTVEQSTEPKYPPFQSLLPRFSC